MQIHRKFTQYCAAALSHGRVYFDLDRPSAYSHPALSSALSYAISSHRPSSQQSPPSGGRTSEESSRAPGLRAGGGGGSLGAAASAAAMESVELGHHAVTSRVSSLRPLLHEMRLVKSPAEMALMRKSAEASISADVMAMQWGTQATKVWQNVV